MAYKELPSQERLKELFDYDPETGVFTWKVNRRTKKTKGKTAGSIDTRGHIQISINSSLYLAHRLAWVYYYGESPGDMFVDHINLNKCDNRIKNLRLATNTQNQYNKSLNKNNKTGYKGVSFHKKKNNYRATIRVDGEYKYLGSFYTPEEASLAYQAAAKQYHKEFARGV